MSKIEQLIQQYCPDGVEWKPLGEISLMKRGTSATKSTMQAGQIPVISGGRQPAFFCNQFNRKGETITIAGSGAGAGYVQYWNEPIFVCDAFSVQGNKDLLTKFLYYYLSNIQYEIYATKKGSGVPHVHISSIDKFEIPLPPLPVQEEIAKILDSFTELQAELQSELQTELQSRQQQYQYYRDKLLSFEGRDDVEWKKLGDVANLLSGFPFNSTQFTDHGIRLMRGVNIKRGQLCFNDTDDRYWASAEGLEKYIIKENDIVISMDGSLVGKSFGMIKNEHLPLLLVQRVARIRSHIINISFIYHCINNWFPNYVEKKKTQGAIPHISMKDIANFPVPVPPAKEQERIASTLDRFDALVNDLSQGLPAEMEARKQQYEYYRDKLSTFKKKA